MGCIPHFGLYSIFFLVMGYIQFGLYSIWVVYPILKIETTKNLPTFQDLSGISVENN